MGACISNSRYFGVREEGERGSKGKSEGRWMKKLIIIVSFYFISVC